MTTSPIAGDSQIANALTTLGTTALGSTRNELLTQLIVAAANATGGGSGGAAWGDITGTLSAQTDLQTALDAKLALAGGTMTGALINSLTGDVTTPSSLKITGAPFTGGTQTTTKPLVSIETSGATSTGWSTSGTMLGVNAPSGFAGYLAEFQANGSSRFQVSADNNFGWGANGNSIVIPNFGGAGRAKFCGTNGFYSDGGTSLCIGTAQFNWTNTASGAGNDAPDTGIARAGAAAIKVTDGGPGYGSIDASAYKVAGVAGANFSGVATNITVVNGIITAIS